MYSGMKPNHVILLELSTLKTVYFVDKLCIRVYSVLVKFKKFINCKLTIIKLTTTD